MDDRYFICTSRLGLRRLEEQDITDGYLNWINDPDVTKFTDVGFFPQSRSDLLEFYESIKSSNDNLFLGIFWIGTGQHIGNVKLGPINWVHRYSSYSILIGDKDFWGKGICTEVTRAVCHHAFSALNLNRVHLGVVDKNEAAIRSYEKVGFTLEGKSRSYFFVDGEYHDNLNMALLKNEFMMQLDRQ